MVHGIVLHFGPQVRVSGEKITGHVELNHVLAREDKVQRVRVVLRASLQTELRTNPRETSIDNTETIPLIRSDISLWTQDSADPSPESPILHLPFQFDLPPKLPPSFYTDSHYTRAFVQYFVKVVVERPALFNLTWKRRVLRPFPLVPLASPDDVGNKTLLMDGWNQDWKSFKRENQIKRWPWGEYSSVYAELKIPALTSFPVSTPVPIRLTIITETKPYKRLEVPSSTAGKMNLFPAPPTGASDIDLILERHGTLRASSVAGTFKEHVAHLGGTGKNGSSPTHGRWSVDEPEWMPHTGENGENDMSRLKRTVHFESTMTFSCPPSFKTKNLSIWYGLHLNIPFPGHDNDLKIDIPITINSGVEYPPPPYDSVSSPPASEIASPPVIPLTIDLPPAYYSVEDHELDAGEKFEGSS